VIIAANIFSQVSRVMIFIRPDGWDGMKDLEVRVGPNGDATTFATNPLCGAAFPGPAVKDKVAI
jgi:hypothetical protein